MLSLDHPGAGRCRRGALALRVRNLERCADFRGVLEARAFRRSPHGLKTARYVQRLTTPGGTARVASPIWSARSRPTALAMRPCRPCSTTVLYAWTAVFQRTGAGNRFCLDIEASASARPLRCPGERARDPTIPSCRAKASSAILKDRHDSSTDTRFRDHPSHPGTPHRRLRWQVIFKCNLEDVPCRKALINHRVAESICFVRSLIRARQLLVSVDDRVQETGDAER